jgi:hypothetical protein
MSGLLLKKVQGKVRGVCAPDIVILVLPRDICAACGTATLVNLSHDHS